MVDQRQGDIFWAETENKRRPVLIVTRTSAIPRLNRLLVAPITRSVRDIPTEVAVEPGRGLRESSAASFDNLELVSKALLTAKVGSVPNADVEICRALGAMADC